ncbi:hypothetical protein Pfo_005701 [Paulownia fortunei]|nr:hypothetical protein Pfo_005701 [Paulownia fortunei]
MDYSKNSITNLAILSLFLATVILLCSWEPLTYKPLFFPQKHSSNISNSLFVQKDELQIALEKASMPNKTVIIAIVNKAYVEPRGNEYPTMFDLFLEGFWAGEETRPLVDHLLVVSMDKTAHERCEFRRLNCYRLAAEDNGRADRFAGEKVYMSDEFIEMMWRRTLFLLDVLRRGYNFIFTDTDILWLRNPFTRLSNNETLDLQISTDVFNGDASSERNLINTGFYFIRSNQRTISLFETWYDMRKNSTGLKEQDVLANLVRDGVLGEFDLHARFLDTLYFSGFCRDSRDVGLVVTVHANCCRSIKAKVVDLKVVLRDWKRFKSKENDTELLGIKYDDMNVDSELVDFLYISTLNYIKS